MLIGCSGPLFFNIRFYIIFLSILTSVSNSNNATASPHDRGLTYQAFEPNYFTFGINSNQEPEREDALFQFSVANIIFDNSSGVLSEKFDPRSSSVWFSYTQKFIFEVSDKSAPIRNSDYMPSIFYQWYNPIGEKDSEIESGFERLRAGWRHRSNGEDGTRSRSWDVAFVELRYLFETDKYFKKSAIEREGGRHALSARLRATLNKSGNNQEVEKFFGNLVIKYDFFIKKYKEIRLVTSFGGETKSGNYKLQFSLPIPKSIPYLNSYESGLVFFLELHSGYDESIIDFNRRSESVRGGIRFDL